MKIFISLLFITLPIFAHPHFFIDVDIRIKDNTIHHIWRFDKINSKLLLFDFDTNKDKKLDKKEQQRFYKTHIEPIKENNFHLFIETKGKEQRLSQLHDFRVVYEKKRVVVSFNTPLESMNDAIICTIDPTVYMAFKLKNIHATFQPYIQKSEFDFCLGVSL